LLGISGVPGQMKKLAMATTKVIRETMMNCQLRTVSWIMEEGHAGNKLTASRLVQLLPPGLRTQRFGLDLRRESRGLDQYRRLPRDDRSRLLDLDRC
jgi:hypothetical protein